MEEIRDHLICRACLRILENKTQSYGYVEDANGNLKDMIMCCVPEMDIYVSSNPIMCFPCIQLLVTVYNFKTRCLNTETVIRSYIQRNNLTEYNQVNLNCIVHELIRLNNYFTDPQHFDKQNTATDPQKPNGVTHGNSLRLTESPESHQSEFDCENVQKTENRFVLGHEVTGETQQECSELFRSPNQLSETGASMRSEVGSDLGSEEGHSILNDEVSGQGIEQYDLNRKTACDMMENDCNTSQNEHRDSEEVQRKKIGCKRVRFEESSKETVEKELEKEPSTENRPRLIIKICKNKITIPPPKNDLPNEKENQKMDAEPIERLEMPPPQTEPPPLELDPDQNLFQCLSCTFVTTNADSFLFHRKSCGAEGSEKKCPHCPHVTNRQYALNKHINTMHTKSLWYTCDFCPYRSTDSSCLRRHKRNVHPERLGNELTCRLCNYRCTTEYHLKKHMVKHDHSTALQCQFCSYSTRDRSNFRKHIFIHNPKPRHCEFCDYKCVSPYQMKLHLKKMHHGVGMEDVDCKSEVSISEVVQDISAAIKEAKSYLGHQTE